jgi:protein-tyrosine phosphatase
MNINRYFYMINEYTMRILMVCLGNICRSPIADGLLRKKVNNLNLNVTVDSAGTIGIHLGEAPDTRMIETAKINGTDISFLKARKFSTDDFEQFDIILAMDENNKKDILSLSKNPNDKEKVHLLLSEITNQTEKNVPDPYYGTMRDFEHVYNLVDEATDVLITKLISKQL